MQAVAMIALLALILGSSSCKNAGTTRAGGASAGGQSSQEPMVRMRATLSPSSSSQASGVVTFEQRPDGVFVEGDLKGLSPGMHGIHLHEFADCGGGDFTAAGGHFNPGGGGKHGAPNDALSHLGDLGNVEADKDGNAHYSYFAPRLVLSGAKSIQWATVVIHAGPDDFSSQPAGNSGGRVACGALVKVP